MGCFIAVSVQLLIAGAGHVEAQSVSYTGSAQYSSGSYYFENSTQSFYLSNGMSVQAGRFTAGIHIPYVYQNTPWVSYTEFGGIPTGGTQHGEVKQSGRQAGQGSGRGKNRITLIDTTSYRQSGFSDPTVSASFTLLSNRTHGTILTLNGSMKIPFADPANGFGTGAWDGGLGISISKRITQKIMVYGNSMYWSLGDMEELELNNALSYGVGVGLFLNNGDVILNTFLNGMTKIAEEFSAPASLNLGAGFNVHNRVFINTTISGGLSEASPDLSIGMGWSIRL